MKRVSVLLSGLLLLHASAFAQTGALMGAAVDADTLSAGEATQLVAAAADLAAAEESPEATVAALQELGYRVPRDPSAPVTVAELSRLIIELSGLRGGVRYRLTGEPVAAFRDLRGAGLFARGTAPGYVPTGAETVDLIHRALRITEAVAEGSAVGRSSPSAARSGYGGVDWNLAIGHETAFAGEGNGFRIASRDTATAGIELYQLSRASTLRYRLGGQFGYSAQEDDPRVRQRRELVVAPARSSVEWLRRPDNHEGAWFRGELGRIPLRGPLGVLFQDSQLADGASASLRWPRWYGELSLGYLGLLERSFTDIHLTQAELADVTESGGVFAPARGIALLRAEGSQLLGGQDAGALVVVQQGFDTEDELSSYYLGVYSQGPVAPQLRQEVMVAAAYSVSDIEEAEGLSMLAHGLLEYTLPPVWLRDARARGRIIYASGATGSTARFPALGGADLGVVFAEPAQDVVSAELGAGARFAVGAVERSPVSQRPYLEPRFALRVFGIPSGEASPRLGIEPSGGFAGVELNPGIDLVLARGFELSADAGFLLGGGEDQTMVLLSGGFAL
ncbi:MAG: hypothetical protein ACOC47_00975 [Alkalispirochaetaceae bacterium]